MSSNIVIQCVYSWRERKREKSILGVYIYIYMCLYIYTYIYIYIKHLVKDIVWPQWIQLVMTACQFANWKPWHRILPIEDADLP